MGKYGRSTMKDLYSDWHWQIENGEGLFLSDIDGFWVETRKGKGLVAVYDLKEPNADITTTEKIIMDWFVGKLPFYIIWPSRDLEEFRVMEYTKDSLERQEELEIDFERNEKLKVFYLPIIPPQLLNKEQYIEFLKNL